MHPRVSSVGQVGASTRALTAVNPEGLEGVDVTSFETSADTAQGTADPDQTEMATALALIFWSLNRPLNSDLSASPIVLPYAAVAGKFSTYSSSNWGEKPTTAHQSGAGRTEALRTPREGCSPRAIGRCKAQEERSGSCAVRLGCITMIPFMRGFHS